MSLLRLGSELDDYGAEREVIECGAAVTYLDQDHIGSPRRAGSSEDWYATCEIVLARAIDWRTIRSIMLRAFCDALHPNA